jgi:hypothetical protein
MIHDDGCGLPIDFQGSRFRLLQAQNRWHLDAPASEAKPMAVIIERVTDPQTGQDEWQIVQVEDHFARLIWGTWGNPPSIDGFGDGADPRICGTVSVGVWEDPPCNIDGKFYVARYIPESNTYRLLVTKSAWMADPERIFYVEGGSSGDGALHFTECTLNYHSSSHMGWPCEATQMSGEARLSMSPVTVLTGATTPDNSWYFSRYTIYACTPVPITPLTIEGDTCDDTSGSGSP